MKNRIILSLCAGLMTLCACHEDLLYIESDSRQYPEEAVGSTPVAFLRAKGTASDKLEVILTKENGFTTEEIYAFSNTPAGYDQAISLTIGDEAMVEEYSAATGVDYTLLPAPFYRIIEGNTLNIRSGATESAPKELKLLTVNPLGNVLEAGRYLLPIIGTSPWQDKPVGTLYVDVTIREPYTDPDGVELYTGDKMFTVFYLNTAKFDPRLANDMILREWDDRRQNKTDYGLGNIVNLRSTSVDFNESTGRVSCLPKPDMRYVLDHYSEMILPVQETGRKVCLCIDGGGQGVGFCNFTDEQISQFVSSAKGLVDEYHLDGINLWDRNSGYDLESAPAMNTTSYPKLIVALREALGPYKLLTLTDYEEPTEYFYDTEATGGIEVGKYIDYAWHGYYSEDEPIQIIDPWQQDLQPVSKLHPRRPIAGLTQKRYGNIHGCCRVYDESIDEAYENLMQWFGSDFYSEQGELCSNHIFVFYDVRSNTQDKYEGNLQYIDEFVRFVFENPWNTQINLLRLGRNYYGKWSKSW